MINFVKLGCTIHKVPSTGNGYKAAIIDNNHASGKFIDITH
jgi:hypothetical protein